MQEMTFKQLLFIALIPLLTIPFIVVVMLLVSKGTLKMELFFEGLSKMQKAKRRLIESSLSKESEIDVNFIPDSFYENIKTDKTRQRREWQLIAIAFIGLTYFYARSLYAIHNEDIVIYAIHLCIAVVAVKALSFKLDIMDIDIYIARELKGNYAAQNKSYNGWVQLDSRFTPINIGLLLILLAGWYSHYLYVTKSRLLVEMAALFAFAITRLIKLREYTHQINHLYETLSQSVKPASSEMKLIKLSSVLEAAGIGIAITLTLYMLSIDAFPLRLLMYLISFGSLYFTGKSLYTSRRYFYKVLLDIDSYRKPVF